MSLQPPAPTEVEARAWAAYERVRHAVRAIKAADAATTAAPSQYWHDELANIDYMIEASPLIVRKLRYHAFHITNSRPYDYREKEDARRGHFEARFEALRAIGGDALIVPESPLLGGFGFDIGGRLFNVDTLKFYEVLGGMRRAGVLDALVPSSRPMVWEIGAGWGGFAYQFKTLFPHATYVITDFPELFLFSAVYLMTQFPDARVLFVGADADADRVETWADADFVFVPNTRTRLVAGAPLALTVNMVSFQEMTTAQVREYVGIAAQARCPRLYSLNRDQSPFNPEISSVAALLSERYDAQEVTMLGTDYPSAFKKPPRGDKADANPLAYRHLAGTLGAPGAPRVVLGMTLHNNARHLREATDSLLGQTRTDFVLLMLDDGSSDETEAIASEYVARDARVHYRRHPTREGMVPTWREVAEIAFREYPGAGYFAWVSDHDRWHPAWLARLVAALDARPDAVLAYPFSPRIDETGQVGPKEPRTFSTDGIDGMVPRWSHFCREGVGAGDMVYGLMRAPALRAAGVFRPVLRPDRLLIAELTLQGHILQVPEPLWFRRQAGVASVVRQARTLFAGATPRWFWLPPWVQHSQVMLRAYRGATAPVRLPLPRLLRMLGLYQATYGWRHARKTDTSHAIGRGVDNVFWSWKVVKRTYHHAVYYTLVEGRRVRGVTRRQRRRATYETLMALHALRGRLRRAGRTLLHEALVLSHRLGLRGR